MGYHMQLIANYGLPIVALVVVCVWLSKLIQYVFKHNKEREDRLMNLISVEIKELSKSQERIAASLDKIQLQHHEEHKLILAALERNV